MAELPRTVSPGQQVLSSKTRGRKERQRQSRAPCTHSEVPYAQAGLLLWPQGQ